MQRIRPVVVDDLLTRRNSAAEIELRRTDKSQGNW
jgi:hypothetical protein